MENSWSKLLKSLWLDGKTPTSKCSPVVCQDAATQPWRVTHCAKWYWQPTAFYCTLNIGTSHYILFKLFGHSQLNTLYRYNAHAQWWTVLWPAIARVRNMPPCMSSSDTSSVPPPTSTTRTSRAVDFSCRPYANAAAVGSLMIRRTSKPATSSAQLQ